MAPISTPTRVLLADDHSLVRAGIRRLLEEFAATEVVGEAADGLAALALVKLHQPDVLIADLTMPRLNGLELAGEVARQCPATKVLMLSMHVDEECVRRAFHRGAKGYLVKDSTASELEVAVRAVARGDTYLSPAVSKYFVAGFLDQCEAPHDGSEGLTPRQRQILQLVAEGHT
ncbi:MAG TPA: response regulator transcription factor, partial [Pirellulales bacterium]|nr:response regulator transcription factor [Pirellulales bacterium]